MKRKLLGALAVAGAATGVLGSSSEVRANVALDAQPVGRTKLRVDGWLKEWGQFVGLNQKVQGSSEVRGSTELAYDSRNLYVALRIEDDTLVRTPAMGKTEDHARVLLAFPKAAGGYVSYEVRVFAGVPGKSKGAVKTASGKPIAGSKVVEATKGKELHVEVQIPWTAFPQAKKIRVGLRGAVQYVDVDSPGKVKAIVGTASGSGSSLPPVRMENEQGLNRALLKPKGLGNRPTKAILADVHGSSELEQVALYRSYITILGGSYRNGKEFFYKDLNAYVVPQLKLIDFDGDGKKEIFLVRREGDSSEFREYVLVLKVDKEGKPFAAFEAESGVVKGDGKIVNKVSIVTHNKKPAIKIETDTAEGWDKASYREPRQGQMDNVLFPWEKVGSRTFAWDGDGINKVKETEQEPTLVAAGSGGGTAGGGGATRTGPPPPPAPRPPSADELLDKVYELYRKTRKVEKSKPRFDFVTDVVADRTTERVLVHKSDVVVFGKGFLGGTSFTYITLPVKDPKDVVHVTARDLTGDGKAEVLVRAIQRMKTSEEFGGVVVDRHAMLVYKVFKDKLQRIYAAETGRQVGKKRVLGSIAFKPAGNGYALELKAGRVIGWTKDTYPFPVETSPSGGLEPLLVPWGDTTKLRYEFDGSTYARK